MTALEELQEAIREVGSRLGPSVVGLGNRWALGSGVVIAEGRVLTNAHNVGREERVAVTFADGREESGRVAGADADGDLAVVEVDTAGAPAVPWSEDGGVDRGRAVFALSNPGGRGPRVTFGFVSATERSFRGPRGRRITGSIEHTAPLARGSSGGPLVDAQGRLLGINTNRLGDGFYLAIAADGSLRERVEALGRGESQPRRRLGIGIAPSFVARRLRRAVGLPEREGVLVRMVEDGSPAAAAGLEGGDLIVEAAGREIREGDDLFEALDGVGSNGTLRLKVVRGAEERAVEVRFEDAPAA